VVEGRHSKKRPTTLSGVRIALVDDNLDIPFTTRLEALLTERTGAKVRRLVKPSGTAPSPTSLIDDAAGTTWPWSASGSEGRARRAVCSTRRPWRSEASTR
jgi:hypothetical protein